MVNSNRKMNNEESIVLRVNDRVMITDPLLTDLHMHTRYCDGHNTPEEMVLSAIEKGMICIGFSGHSYVELDPTCGMNAGAEENYRAEIADLKERYRDRITIYCGIEQDSYTITPPSAFDYAIGSVHYLDTPEGPLALDDTPELFCRIVRDYFHNDYYLAAEAYFDAEAQVIEKTGADIIGHFDLFCKFNTKFQLFDEQHPRYIRAWKQAADALLGTGKLFEINTGAISRGWRDVPYPAPPIREYLTERGARFLYASDSHRAETIGYGFRKSI